MSLLMARKRKDGPPPKPDHRFNVNPHYGPRPVRLTFDDQFIDRLHLAAAFKGLSMSEFARRATVAMVEQIEREMRR